MATAVHTYYSYTQSTGKRALAVQQANSTEALGSASTVLYLACEIAVLPSYCTLDVCPSYSAPLVAASPAPSTRSGSSQLSGGVGCIRPKLTKPSIQHLPSLEKDVVRAPSIKPVRTVSSSQVLRSDGVNGVESLWAQLLSWDKLTRAALKKATSTHQSLEPLPR